MTLSVKILFVHFQPMKLKVMYHYCFDIVLRYTRWNLKLVQFMTTSRVTKSLGDKTNKTLM